MGDKLSLKFFYQLKQSGKKNIMEWCMKYGLIASSKKCPRCGAWMKIGVRPSASDGYEWSCWLQGRSSKISIRDGSWFSNSKLNIIDILILIITAYWIYKCPTGSIVEELEIGAPTISQWMGCCRAICAEVCKLQSEKIGGEDVVIEIDALNFGRRGNKRCNRGENWIFCGMEKLSKKCIFVVVDSKGKNVFLEIIRNYVLPGTTIISTSLKLYDYKTDVDFVNLSVNHSLKFKYPDTGHTNSLDGTFNALKRTLPYHLCHGDEVLKSYLFEFIWRRQCKVNRIASFLDAIKKIYSQVEGNDCKEIDVMLESVGVGKLDDVCHTTKSIQVSNACSATNTDKLELKASNECIATDIAETEVSHDCSTTNIPVIEVMDVYCTPNVTEIFMNYEVHFCPLHANRNKEYNFLPVCTFVKIVSG